MPENWEQQSFNTVTQCGADHGVYSVGRDILFSGEGKSEMARCDKSTTGTEYVYKETPRCGFMCSFYTSTTLFHILECFSIPSSPFPRIRSILALPYLIPSTHSNICSTADSSKLPKTLTVLRLKTINMSYPSLKWNCVSHQH
jgi:hypothetical protein